MEFTMKEEVVLMEKTVDVELIRTLRGITLTVDGWNVFVLKFNGTGHLVGSINGKSSGLKVDSRGKIVLEN